MEALWPDLGAEAAGANLRKALHYARRALASKDVLAVESRVLAFVAELHVDAIEFERNADAALAAGDRAMAASVADQYAGDLLPDDPYEPWLTEPRERLRRKYLQLVRACERWERVVELEPADEPAHRALIGHHLEKGRRTAAIRQFERLRESLRDELGLAPDPETVALYEQVLGMDGPETPTAAERARALLAWGLVHRNRMELDEAERHARQAQTLALQTGLGHELGEASTLLAFIALARGTWQETFRNEFVRAIKQDATLAMSVFDAHLCFAEFYMYGPDGHESAEQYTRDLLKLAIPADFTAGEGLTRLLLGEIFMVVGRVDEAEEELGRAADLYRACACLSGQSIALERLVEAEILRHRHGEGTAPGGTGPPTRPGFRHPRPPDRAHIRCPGSCHAGSCRSRPGRVRGGAITPAPPRVRALLDGLPRAGRDRRCTGGKPGAGARAAGGCRSHRGHVARRAMGVSDLGSAWGAPAGRRRPREGRCAAQ